MLGTGLSRIGWFCIKEFILNMSALFKLLHLRIENVYFSALINLLA